MQYDVFISKNTKDLPRIRPLISFFDRSGINYFESERHLVGCGQAQYKREISNAIASSRNMIVVCSKNENATGEGDNSLWVYHEWMAFHNEMLSKRKIDANIIVLTLDNVDVADLPLDLRVYQNYPMHDFLRPEMLSYLKPDARTVMSADYQSYSHRNRSVAKNIVYVSAAAVLVVAAALFILKDKKTAVDVPAPMQEVAVPSQPTQEKAVQPAAKPAAPVVTKKSEPVSVQTAPVQSAPVQTQTQPVQSAPITAAPVSAPSLQQKADSGDPAACYQLALDYQNGTDGVARNLSNAFVYMKKAADAGYVNAFRPLGEMYHGGRGVTKDREEAARWYKLAADNGDARALRLLNNM